MAKRRIVKADQEAAQAAAAAPFVELGITGLTRYGAISRVYEEFLRELQGPEGMRLLREQLDNCPITGAIMFAVEYLCRGVTFRIDPADPGPNVDTNRATQVADRVRGALFDDLDVTFPDLLSEIMSMTGFGWALHEMVFKRCLGMEPPQTIDASSGKPKDGSELLPPETHGEVSGPTGQGAQAAVFVPSKFNDGFVGLRSLGLRAQETIFMWEFDAASKATVMQQMAPPDWKLRRIPIAKCLHFKTRQAKGNPEGRALIRNSVTSYLYKKKIQNVEAIGIERDLAGYPRFKTVAPDPAKNIKPKDLWNAKDPEAVQLLSQIQNMVRNIRNDEQAGLVLPYWLDFDLVSAGSGRRQFNTNDIITRYEQRIAMSVLADFIMLGHEAVGSKALASTKSALFTAALNAILDGICATFNRNLFPLLMKLNGIDQALCPTMAHGDVENVPLDALGDFIQRLAAAGMPLFPDPDLEKALRDAAHLPDTGVQDPDDTLDDRTDNDVQEPGAHPQAATAAQQATAATAGRPQFGKRRDVVRKLIERNKHGRIVKLHTY